MSDKVNKMVSVLRQWQAIERQTINSTAEIFEESKNPLVQLIMEIIRHDSLMHHRVQQFLISSVTEKDVAVSRDDLAEIWKKIEAHDKVEKKTVELAKGLKADSWSSVHKLLLEYLITDEEKHDSLLEQLGQVKEGMSKASGA